MILFYTTDPGASSPLTCGGEEELISSPKHVGFKSCSESSRLSQSGWGCV